MKITYKFVLRNRLNTDGSQSIIFNITLDRVNIPFYTDMKIHARFWDPIKQRAKDGYLLHDSYNNDITTMLQNFSSYISECKFAKMDIDKYTIKNFFNNKKNAKPDKDFFAFCADDLEKYGKTDLNKNTLTQNKNFLASIKEFRNNLSFDDITVTFLKDYEKYLKETKHLGINTIYNKIKFIRTYINKAIKQGIYDKYVFKNFIIKMKTSKPNFLSNEEFNKLVDFYNKDDISIYFKKHLQYFLFACCTGLRYSDLKSLLWTDIKDNFIYIRMHKTQEIVVVPLNSKIISFLPLSSTEGKIFSLPTNQCINLILKNIATAAGIQKNLTFHVSRHTFATICLNLGIPLHCVQKLLGHKNPHTTEIYARLSNKTLEAEMQKWN